jgi:hypothetical protein
MQDPPDAVRADQRHPGVHLGHFVGQTSLAPIRMGTVQLRHLGLDLGRDPPCSWRNAKLLVGLQTCIPVLDETRLPVVKSAPPNMRFSASRSNIAGLLPVFKEQFPLLRCRRCIVDTFCFHTLYNTLLFKLSMTNTIVDTLGLLLMVLVHSASIQDGSGGYQTLQKLFDKIKRSKRYHTLTESVL